MTAIERTAYPRFKSHPSAKELAELYTPTAEEVQFVQSQVRSKSGLLRLIVMLKAFQRLGYLSHPEGVPVPVIVHLRACLQLNSWISAMPTLPSRYRYQQAIRAYLGVKPYNHEAQKLAAEAIAAAAAVKDHPADLINVAIATLVKERYELPAFSTLDRLAGKIRSIVNTRLFHQVSDGLINTSRANLPGWTPYTRGSRLASNPQSAEVASSKCYPLSSTTASDKI